jgi:type IV secretion system protein VirB1
MKLSPRATVVFHCLLAAGNALTIAALGALAPASALAQSVAGVDPETSALIARCAPTVHPETMAAVVSAESRGHQFAIADAGPVSMPWAQRKALVRSLYPGSLEEAVATAQSLVASGHTVSLGIAQVNDRNLARMGVSIREVFDPCTNVSVGGRILTDFYEKAVAKFGAGPTALHAALSAYNSGDWARGAKDGYVERVYRQLGKPLAITSQRVAQRAAAPAAMVPRISTAADGSTTRTFTLKADNYSVAEMH